MAASWWNNLVRSIQSLFGLDNYQEVALLGAFPLNTKLGRVLKLEHCFEEVSPTDSLMVYLREDLPCALVTFVGIGSHSGFLVSEVSESSRKVLPESWWRAPSFDVSLFLFSCFSADYLRESDVLRHSRGAICYEGKIMLSMDDSEYWTWFVGELRGSLRRCGRVGSRAYAEMQRQYSKAILGEAQPEELGLSYLIRICLVSQSERIRFLRGAGGI